MRPELNRLLKEVGELSPLLEDELRAELDRPAVLWPEGVMDVAAELFSASVYNPESRTFKSLDRRIAWVVGTWMDRHGPMTDSQRSYMAELLIWALRKAAKDAAGDKRKLYSYALTQISGLINEERVHEGFKRRAAAQADVRELVSGVLQGV